MKFFRLVIILYFCSSLIGCASIPKGFLALPEETLEKRTLQMRQYETVDEEQIIIAIAGVLQDLGFTLDDSESELGFIAGSKSSDATDGGQIAGAIFMDIMFGTNLTSTCDATQKVKASVIGKLSYDKSKIVVRVTFQRLVWNQMGALSRVETISDPEIYQKFFDSLSKAIFLEAHKI